MNEFDPRPETPGTPSAAAPQYSAAEEHPEAIPAARKAYSRSTLHLALYALIGEAVVFAVALVLQLIGHPTESLGLSVQYLAHFIPMYCISFPIYLLLSRGMDTLRPTERKMSFGKWLLAFMMSEGMAVTGSLIGTIVTFCISAIFHVDTSTDMLLNGTSGEGYFIFTLIASIGAPIVEEMLFRKVLIDRIRKYGDGTAILLSGILFGLFHGNFTQFFYAAFLGMFFAYIYIRTGRIRYTIALHMAINTLSTALAGTLLRNIDLDAMMNAAQNNDTAVIIGMLPKLIPLLCYVVCIYGLAIAGVVLLIVNRKKFHIDPPTVRLPKGTQAKTACMNLGFWTMVIFCVILFVISAS